MFSLPSNKAKKSPNKILFFLAKKAFKTPLFPGDEKWWFMPDIGKNNKLYIFHDSFHTIHIAKQTRKSTENRLFWFF